MQNLVLTTEKLSKKYGSKIALNTLDISIKKGSFFGILGPNGSGKTTFLSMISGVLKPSSGHFSWFGQGNSSSLRKRIGTLIEKPNFLPHLSAYDNLKISCLIKDINNEEEISRVLQEVELAPENLSFDQFSFGMKQRLGIASCLLGNPEVLILDEYNNGLDALAMRNMRGLLRKLHENGTTIIIATHLINEVEKLCTDALILKNGENIFNGNLENLYSKDIESDSYFFEVRDNQKFISMMEKHRITFKVEENGYRISTTQKQKIISFIPELILENQIIALNTFTKTDLESNILDRFSNSL